MTLPTPAAVGSLALAKLYLAKTIAACATVQSLCDVASAAAAEAHIWIDELPPPADNADEYTVAQLQELRPFILIGHNLRGHYRAGRVAAESWADQGRLWLLIEADVLDDLLQSGDNAAEPGLVMRRADNLIGQIADELRELAWQGDYLAIDELEIDGPRRTDADDPEDAGFGDHVSAFIRLRWNGGLG